MEHYFYVKRRGNASAKILHHGYQFPVVIKCIFHQNFKKAQPSNKCFLSIFPPLLSQ